MDITTLVGSFAGFCTTVSYFPQLKKCRDTGKSGDLTFKTFSILATGVGSWVVYGFLKRGHRDHRHERRELLLPCRHTLVQAQRELTIRLSTAQLSGRSHGRSC
jgi:uncharacterized protein with PQ loop repeat